jgi:hypothetical protein
VHPLDVRGKTPINLSKGIFPVSGGMISSLTPVAAGQEWKVAKSVPGNTLSSNLAATTAPQRVSRTLVGGNLGAHVITMDRNSSIAYDAREHRFVNTNSAPQTERAQNSVVATEPTGRTGIAAVPTGATAATAVPNARVATPSAPMRSTVPASRAMTPPAAPRGTETGRSGWSGGSGNFPSSRSSSSSATSTAAPHSAPAASSSAGSSSGARPH